MHTGLDRGDELHASPKDACIEIPLLPDTIKVRWAGNIDLSNTSISVVPSSLELDPEVRNAARTEFASTMQPGQSDMERLRYEGTHESGDQLSVQASTGISYGEHNIRRFVTGVAEDQVINPLTMYALLQDKDGNFIGGVWNQDQKGKIASAPVGFLDAPSGGNPPRNFVEEIRLKFQNQVRLGSDESVNIQEALDNTHVRAVISGVNQDTTILMCSKSTLLAEEISLKGTKYSSMILIPPTEEVLEQVLETGRFQGMEVNDLFLAGLAIHVKDIKQRA